MVEASEVALGAAGLGTQLDCEGMSGGEVARTHALHVLPHRLRIVDHREAASIARVREVRKWDVLVVECVRAAPRAAIGLNSRGHLPGGRVGCMLVRVGCSGRLALLPAHLPTVDRLLVPLPCLFCVPAPLHAKSRGKREGNRTSQAEQGVVD